MQEIKYEVDNDGVFKTLCEFIKNTMVGSCECEDCEHCTNCDDWAQIVTCNNPLTNKFLQDCLLALNWQRGTEADIVKVLEAARAYSNANVVNEIECTEENSDSVLDTEEKLFEVIKEPTDAPTND